MPTYSIVIFAAGLWAATLLAVPANTAKNVTINKCCPLGETLSAQKCLFNHNSAPEWKLKVFSPAKKIYLTKNALAPNWHLRENSRPDCDQPTVLSANLGNYVPFQNGSLFVVEYNRLIHPSLYCLDYSAVMVCLHGSRSQHNDGASSSLMDAQASTVPEVRVKKCCGTDAIFSTTNQSCIFVRDEAYNIDVGPDKVLSSGFPNCNQHNVVFVAKLHEADLLPNGTIFLASHQLELPAADYCLEHELENSGRSPSIMICNERFPFATETPASQPDLRFTLYPIGLALSAIFLAATLAAGSLLPASHHMLHWRCQTNHIACLLFGYILLCITHLAGQMSPIPCFLIAVSMHFLFLAAFFWLNTMCFNIWWTFRDLRPQSAEKSQERCRLRVYQVYAWGGPLFIAGTAAILDTIPSADYTFLKPNFGTNKCWFYGDAEILTFFIGPIGILLFINLVLFAATARELTCGLWKRELVKSNTERAALGRVCLKLVVVMGVTWIADVISWVVGGPQEIWYLTDIINCLQGVFIFIVVGCQPQVLSAIKRLWCWRKLSETGTAGTTNHHSSSSQGLPSMGDSVTNQSVSNTTKSIPLETSC